MTILRGPRLTLRPTRAEDMPRLLEIAREPSVASHFNDVDRELLLGEGADADERVTAFVIAHDDTTIGWIMGWEKLDEEYRHAGIDLFLSSAFQGKGYGPEAIRLVCRFLFEERGHHRITIDPAADHASGIRAYEKVGFKRVGVLRKYERGPDGTFHDGLLLDLLPEDLT